jgi:hypothetical protein
MDAYRVIVALLHRLPADAKFVAAEIDPLWKTGKRWYEPATPATSYFLKTLARTTFGTEYSNNSFKVTAQTLMEQAGMSIQQRQEAGGWKSALTALNYVRIGTEQYEKQTRLLTGATARLPAAPSAPITPGADAPITPAPRAADAPTTPPRRPRKTRATKIVTEECTRDEQEMCHCALCIDRLVEDELEIRNANEHETRLQALAAFQTMQFKQFQAFMR